MKLNDVKRGGLGHPERIRVGRGRASGKGGTCGRGHKGYGARSGSKKRYAYEGGQTPYFLRLPKRGFSNVQFAKNYAIVNVADLNRFNSGDTVNAESLVEKGLIRKKVDGVRILGKGTLEIPLTVEADHFTEAAARKITEAGGEVKSA